MGAFIPGSDRRTTGIVQLEALAGGVTYTFMLTAIDVFGESSYSTVEVVMNEAPSSGSLSIVPSNGYVFETDFTFLSSNWVDEDLPLSYKFVYTVGYDGSWTPVADAQDSASYDALLPQGLPEDNHTITGMTVVYDYYNAFGTATDTTRVLPVKYSTAQLANISAALTQEALESGDPETSMQIMGATHKSLSGGSSDERRKLTSSSEEAALRTTLMATLKETYAVSEITEANVDSMMSTLDGIVNAPNDLTSATAIDSLLFAKLLLRGSVDNGIGISTTGTGYAGTALSYLLLSSMFNASDVTSATPVSAANVTDTLRYLSIAQLDGAYAGVGYTLSSSLVHSSSARKEAQYLGGDTKGVPGSNAKVSFPSNFSHAAKLDVSGTTYVDTRVVTLDTDVYTAYSSYRNSGNTVEDNMYGSSTYNTDLNSAVTQVEVMDEDGNVFDVGGLDPADPIYVTMQATRGIDTNFSGWKMEKICYTDGQVIEINCPLGTQTYTCDSSLGGVDGTYFLDFTCPGVVPTCLWWSEDEGEWAHEGCGVVNYTSTNVTCACTHLTDFVLGKNVSTASFDVTYTSAPTSLPTPVPTTLPSPSPTSAPYPMPTVEAGFPTKTPIAAPTGVPSSAPSLVPSPGASPESTTVPTASDTVAVAASMTMDGLDASAITDDDIAAIKTGLAEVISGVNASHISGISVTNASTRRRRRSLLGTAATVSFTVQVSLSETSFADASSLEETVSDTLPRSSLTAPRSSPRSRQRPARPPSGTTSPACRAPPRTSSRAARHRRRHRRRQASRRWRRSKTATIRPARPVPMRCWSVSSLAVQSSCSSRVPLSTTGMLRSVRASTCLLLRSSARASTSSRSRRSTSLSAATTTPSGPASLSTREMRGLLVPLALVVPLAARCRTATSRCKK